MTIDEAIKNNEEHSKAHHNDAYPDYYDAIKLGIEALKWRQHDEKEVPNWAACPLPGETKD